VVTRSPRLGHGTLELVAHQGGWDEILLVTVPIVLIIGLLAIAKRRVDGAVRAEAAGREPVETPGRDAAAPPPHE
jgi:hypothetical protein